MCTLTAARIGGCVRVVFNRDEQRSRAAAAPPRSVLVGGRAAIMPIDPLSGGSWIAVNDAGLVFALLNVNRIPAPPTPPPRLSRGLVIPRLVGCATVESAERRLQESDAADFEAFRLLVIERDAVAEAVSDGATIAICHGAWDGRPMMRTSSGLGDAVVGGPRGELFARSTAGREWSRDEQDAFHAHVFRGRPELSVLMSREDARTVSRTTIQVEDDQAWIRYEPIPSGSPQIGRLPLATRSGGND